MCLSCNYSLFVFWAATNKNLPIYKFINLPTQKKKPNIRIFHFVKPTLLYSFTISDKEKIIPVSQECEANQDQGDTPFSQSGENRAGGDGKICNAGIPKDHD